MGAQRIEGNHQLAGNLRTRESSGKQLEDVKFALGEGIDEKLGG